MKKKNIGLIIAIIIIAVVLVVGGAFAVLYFMTDLFKTNDQLFWKYVSNNNQIAEVIKSKNEETQEAWKQNNSYTSQGNMKISVTKESGTKEITLGTTSKHNASNGRTYSDVTLYNEGTELLKASYINSGDFYAVHCKDIYEPYYIGIRNSDLKELFKKFGASEEDLEQVPNSIPINTIQNASLLSEEETKYLSDTYFNVLANNISKEKYTKLEKSDITINDKSYSTNGYMLTLNEQDIKQIAISILSKAKEDEQTIAILNKLLQTEGQTQDVNINEALEQLLQSVQNKDLEETSLTISVYNAGNKVLKTQINVNNQVELTIDLDKSQENKEFVSIYGKTIDSENTEKQEQLQLNIEKQTLDNMVNYTVNLVNNQTGYKITMTTSLGNVIENKIENNSKITIFDKGATIEASYYKVAQLAVEEVEIQELTNTNAVIINNYPVEQLEVFFEGLGEKASKVIPEKIGQLNIQMQSPEDILYYAEGIASSIFAVANANGTPTTVGIVGVTAINLVNSSLQQANNILEQSNSINGEVQYNEIKETMQLVQTEIQMEALTGQDFKNINDIKTLVEEKFSKEYEIIDWGNINFSTITKQLEGTITIKAKDRVYLVDFTNKNVEEK